MQLEIRKKDSGSNRWWIWQITPEDWPRERSIRGFKTKTLATLFMAALLGDSDSAQKWYRKEIEKHLKDRCLFPAPADAWEFSAQTAKQFGFSPSFVNADPNTYEPLD